MKQMDFSDINMRDLEDDLSDMGIVLDPAFSLEEGDIDVEMFIDCYNKLLSSIKLLIISGQLPLKKLEKTHDIARNLK